jgi:integrase
MASTTFKYRGGYRSQVTVGSHRRTKDFRTRNEALDWVIDQEVKACEAKVPELGGPTKATLAQTLKHYAGTYSVQKRGCRKELTRINRYLRLAGMPLLRPVLDAEGKLTAVEHTPESPDGAAGPDAFRELLERRRAKHARTNATMAKLAKLKVSQITKFMVDELMATMTLEGISASTIQKEIALLKVVFNTAAGRWNWDGFKNPCIGCKLGKSTPKFVHLSQEQFERLVKALAECDNPYIWPLVDIAIYFTARKKSLLDLRWDDIDLEHRAAQLLDSKGGTVMVPVAKRVLSVLEGLPRDPSGKVFPLTDAAVDSAWDRIRERAGLKSLQFRDLRHLGGTHYARYVGNAHALREILGQKTLHMAQIYVNFVKDDLLALMDKAEPVVPMLGALPPAAVGTALEMMNRKKGERLNGGAKAGAKGSAAPVVPTEADVPVLHPDNVVPIRPEINAAWPCKEVAAKRIYRKG